MEPNFSPFSLPLHAPTPRPVYPVSARSSPSIAPPLRSMSAQPTLDYFPFSTESSILLLPEASHPRQYWAQNKGHERKVRLLARDMGYEHDSLPFLPDEPRYAPANAPRRPVSRAEQRTPRPHSEVSPPRALSSSYPTRHTHVPLSPRHACTAPPRAASPLSAGVRPGATRQHPQGPRSPQRSPQLRLSSIQRPTSPRFHRPVSPTLPDLSPDSPEQYRHSTVSLPSPSPSQPGSPGTAKDSLKGILGWNGGEDDEGDERYGDVWRGVVERRRWDQQVTSRSPVLQEPPKTRHRSSTLPSSIPRPKTPQPLSFPPTKTSFLRSLFSSPPMTPSSPLPPKPPSPILKAPPTSPVLAPLPQRFDVERVYESLRSAKGGGQVWFDEVEGVGSPTVEEEEEEEVEKVEGLKAQETKKRKTFPW
ncbi:hypothetical protein L198_03611 [Cryptococcus wingfieldii CBS 7118]|uniref:Uncharacterized protein n=1 Tax=Cryptococcus wingfieldii CBS 7118 TaxID=1295528 RepID=A0A1E3JBY8_9TREE|nr:hypothetical protein L198_03611 [Cryptococcus wingfieldii CBS 7118]ODN98367.1 hypothetical protein L198_03611 [Cryptococcus wingfieldii CBS 7118]